MNKKLHLTTLAFLGILLPAISFAQKTEINLLLNSGLSSYGGPNAYKVTALNSPRAGITSGYTNHPYGSKSTLAYGFSGEIKRITSASLLFGLNVGYEVLGSRIKIDRVFGVPVANGGIGTVEADGNTTLHYGFLNAHPYLGYRFKGQAVSFDLSGGFDFAYTLSGKEKGKAKAKDGSVYTTSVENKHIDWDFRPRMQLTANYNRVGIYAGYSYGLINYTGGYACGSSEVFSRVIRLGLLYKLK